jgi:hypothetical protein
VLVLQSDLSEGADEQKIELDGSAVHSTSVAEEMARNDVDTGTVRRSYAQGSGHMELDRPFHQHGCAFEAERNLER